MNAPKDYERAERIAFASSAPDDNRFARWTELAVYFDREDDRRPWIAVVRGCSNHPREKLREEVVRVGTLERAMKLFDDRSPLYRSVAVQAEEWRSDQVVEDMEKGPISAEILGTELQASPERFTGTTQDEALDYLFGPLLESAKPQTLVERVFEIGESSVRMQIVQKRDIKIPLRTAARYMDRDAVRRAATRATGEGDA
jgi:hypothetical protein